MNEAVWKIESGRRAEQELNGIDPDAEFRNQQVAGSIPAGGFIPATLSD